MSNDLNEHYNYDFEKKPIMVEEQIVPRNRTVVNDVQEIKEIKDGKVEKLEKVDKEEKHR